MASLTSDPRRPWLLVAALLLIGALAWTGLHTSDHLTWLLEVFPVLIALPLLVATQQRYPLTTLLYVAIFCHALVLMVGGQYTYAKVPLGFWLQDVLELQRNPYDKLGHFMQGFVPALVAREVLLRGAYVRGAKMLAFLVLCVVMSISATYELIEWSAAVLLGQGADDFLGTQGDQWDTQSDMAFAGLGAIVALLLCSRVQDRELARLTAITSCASQSRG
jgi:putative membrane protein